MTDASCSNPKKILTRWACGILAGAALVGLFNLLLFRHAAALREANPWTYLREADRLRAENDWMGAVGMLREAARRDPNSPVPWERMGLLYYNARHWDKALDAYRTALKNGSRDADVRGKIIWCLIHLNRYDGAAEFGKACLEEGYASAHIHRAIGEALRRAGRHDEAIPYLETALKSFPNDPYLIDQLAQACRLVGDEERARQLRQRIDDLQGR